MDRGVGQIVRIPEVGVLIRLVFFASRRCRGSIASVRRERERQEKHAEGAGGSATTHGVGSVGLVGDSLYAYILPIRKRKPVLMPQE